MYGHNQIESMVQVKQQGCSQHLRGNFPPGELILHNAAIRACEQATKWQQALQLLHQAEENQLRSNEITYSSVPWTPWTPWTPR